MLEFPEFRDDPDSMAEYSEAIAAIAELNNILDDEALWLRSATELTRIESPVYLGGHYNCPVNRTIYWIYQNNLYSAEFGKSEEDQRLVISALLYDQAKAAQRLKRKAEQFHTVMSPPESRLRIPDDVRDAVWRRDEGKCCRCGSRERLEFDHIIPVSKGGGNTARNIELLCESCNRAKGDTIG
ncbi:MAG: HNH endonuclease [Planctomycetaceae bacterium]|nr:HNH endonuclease [Planctomycetaceae bacterium]